PGAVRELLTLRVAVDDVALKVVVVQVLEEVLDASRHVLGAPVQVLQGDGVPQPSRRLGARCGRARCRWRPGGGRRAPADRVAAPAGSRATPAPDRSPSARRRRPAGLPRLSAMGPPFKRRVYALAPTAI